MESVISGNLDFRLQHKTEEGPNASEKKQKNVSGRPSSVREKAKLWEFPSQHDMTSSRTSCAGQKNPRQQQKFEEVPLQSADRRNSSSGGQHNEGQQHQFQGVPQQSEHQQDSSSDG